MFHVEHVPGGQEPLPPGLSGRCDAAPGPSVALSASAGREGQFAALRTHGPCFRRGAARAAGFLVLAALMFLPGCAGTRSVRLCFPAASGLETVRPGLYVDPAMTAPQREVFIADLEEGRRRAEEFYGGLVSSPTVVACASMACYRRFGGIGPKGVSRNGALLLSPGGLTPVIVAHEWSHAELAARVGQLRTWWSVPQWFDEGIAVLLSRDPIYTEEAWRAATDNGTKVPPLSALETLRGWLRVTGKDGKTKQLSYGTARHEVAGWYAVAGPEGLRALIEGLRDGDNFRELYEKLWKAGARTDVPRGTSPQTAGAVRPAMEERGR